MDNERKPRGYWTYDKCKELASTCKSRLEMKNKSRQAYDVSRKNKWLEDFFGDKTRNSRGYWNDYEICRTEAMKYSCVSDFVKGNCSAYYSARRNKWVRIFFPYKKGGLPSSYTYKTCKELALKCKSRTEFYKRYRQAWQISKDNLWLNDFTWFNKNNTYNAAKPIAQIDPNNGEIIKVFPSILDAERELKLSRIIRKIKKDNNTLVGGFRWEIFDCHND